MSLFISVTLYLMFLRFTSALNAHMSAVEATLPKAKGDKND